MSEKIKKEFIIKYRKSFFSEIVGYCDLAKPNDFVEITEWSNGNGVDINISSVLGNRTISMTWGEFKLVKKMMKTIYQ